MKKIIRQFLAFIISLVLIFAPTYSFASGTGWTVKDSKSFGSAAAVVAIKDGKAAAVKVIPSAIRLGGRLLGGYNTAALILAVTDILGDGVDWVLDPANNAVKYVVPAKNDPNVVCKYKNYIPAEYITVGQFCSIQGKPFREITRTGQANCGGSYYSSLECPIPSGSVEKLLPIAQVARRVITNANSSHVPSQQAITDTVTEMVITGAVDVPLQTGAIPGTQVTVDDFLFPAIPGDQTDDDSIVVGSPKVSPADAARDAREAAERAKAAADAARDAARDAQRDAADAARDVVNAANDAKEAADEEAKAIADAAKTAAQAAKDAAAAQAKAAADAAAQAVSDATAARDAARAAADAAKAAADADATAANKAARDKALADAKAADKAVSDAIKAAEKAKAAEKEAARKDTKAPAADAFELPNFCSWASTVCEFVEWATADPQLEEPPEFKPDVTDIDKFDNVDISKNYINASGQCPAPEQISIMFGTIEMSYEPLCIILGKLSGIIVACAYLTSAFMIVRTI